MIKRFVLVLSALLMLPLMGALTLAWLLPEQVPATQAYGRLQAGDIGAAKRLVSRDQLRSAFHGQPLSLKLPQLEVNTIAQDMAQRLLGGSAAVRIAPSQADITVSLPMARTPLRALTPLGPWLNVYATLNAEPKGPPTLSQMRVGRLPVPPALALWAARQVAAHYQVLEPALIGLSAVNRVAFQHASAQVQVQWSDSHTSQAFGLLVPASDVERLFVYHQQLGALLQPPVSAGQLPPPALPLVPVLRAMFEQARQRTVSQALSNDGGTLNDIAARENRAVLAVLALQASQTPPQRLIPAAKDWPALPVKPLLLHGRMDFAQHYVLSAMLASSLGGRLTDVAGLYKELLDASPGQHGSGFSFNDIAADKAGNRFGQRARHNPVELQIRASEGDTDAFFMPDVSDLPQFLTEQALRDRFGGVGSATYNEMVGHIDARVDQLAVLR